MLTYLTMTPSRLWRWDHYISSELLLPIGNEQKQGQVIACNQAADGTLLGQAHDNPILLDTHVSWVEYNDSNVIDLSANLITECMYSECN